MSTEPKTMVQEPLLEYKKELIWLKKKGEPRC